MEHQSTCTKEEAQLLRIHDVAMLTTLSKSCINLWVSEDKFPEPITLCPTVKVWRLKDVVNWISDQSVKPRNEAVPKKPKTQSLESIESVTQGFENGPEKPSLKIVHG
jgi:predicted DNA-binding transcriptional regulator AlpA